MKSYMGMLSTCLRLLSGVLGTITLINLASLLSLLILSHSTSSYSPALTLTLVLTTAQLCILICAYLKMAWEIRHAKEQEESLQTINKQLAENDRLKEQVLFLLNHEVRTPLSSVKGYADLIRSYGDRMSRDILEHYLLQINQACDEATIILDSFLHRQETPEHVHLVTSLDLKETILAVMTTFAPRIQFEKRQIDLQLERVAVRANPLKLRQVLRNVLNNALNYSPPGTRLQILVTRQPEHLPQALASSHTSQRIYLSIKDEGIGIPPAEHTRLFEPFQRLESGQQLSPYGNGLGLYLSRQMLAEMEGQIWLESEGVPGRGTQVWISLLEA